MNPATPGPLTILLVPPPGDTALLADEAGGRVPTMRYDHAQGRFSAPCPVCGSPTRWFRPPTDQMDPCYICTADAQHRFDQSAVTPMAWQIGRNYGTPSALLLVHEGAPVAMGCDRASRWHRRSQPFAARRPHIPLVWTVAYARDVEDHCRSAGCRVVLLRDGREVES